MQLRATHSHVTFRRPFRFACMEGLTHREVSERALPTREYDIVP